MFVNVDLYLGLEVLLNPHGSSQTFLLVFSIAITLWVLQRISAYPRSAHRLAAYYHCTHLRADGRFLIYSHRVHESGSLERGSMIAVS